MATTVSGTITLNTTLNDTVASGGAVLTTYTVPVNVTHSQAYATGSSANQVANIATAGGSAAATPANVDIRALTALDGTSTSAWTVVREVIIYNDSTSAGFILNYVLDASNAFTAFMTGTLTGVKLGIPAGSCLRLFRPLDSAGWTVGSSARIISLDPGANTIAYRVVVAGG